MAATTAANLDVAEAMGHAGYLVGKSKGLSGPELDMFISDQIKQSHQYSEFAKSGLSRSKGISAIMMMAGEFKNSLSQQMSAIKEFRKNPVKLAAYLTMLTAVYGTSGALVGELLKMIDWIRYWFKSSDVEYKRSGELIEELTGGYIPELGKLSLLGGIAGSASSGLIPHTQKIFHSTIGSESNIDKVAKTIDALHVPINLLKSLAGKGSVKDINAVKNLSNSLETSGTGFIYKKIKSIKKQKNNYTKYQAMDLAQRIEEEKNNIRRNVKGADTFDKAINTAIKGPMSLIPSQSNNLKKLSHKMKLTKDPKEKLFLLEKIKRATSGIGKINFDSAIDKKIKGGYE